MVMIIGVSKCDARLRGVNGYKNELIYGISNMSGAETAAFV